MSYRAYEKIQSENDTPSQTEFRLFAQVTKALQDASALNRLDPAFVKALDWNRRMWSTLSTDCALPGNKLPDKTRAGIVSLAIWVSRHSSKVARGQGSIDALINVNRTIMGGLSKQAGTTAGTQPAASSSQQASTDTVL